MMQGIGVKVIFIPTNHMEVSKFVDSEDINILNELGGRRWVFLHKLMSDLVSNVSMQHKPPGSRVC